MIVTISVFYCIWLGGLVLLVCVASEHENIVSQLVQIWALGVNAVLASTPRFQPIIDSNLHKIISIIVPRIVSLNSYTNLCESSPPKTARMHK